LEYQGEVHSALSKLPATPPSTPRISAKNANVDNKQSSVPPTEVTVNSNPSLEVVTDVVCKLSVFLYGVLRHTHKISTHVGYDTDQIDAIDNLGSMLYRMSAAVFGKNFHNTFKQQKQN